MSTRSPRSTGLIVGAIPVEVVVAAAPVNRYISPTSIIRSNNRRDSTASCSGVTFSHATMMRNAMFLINMVPIMHVLHVSACNSIVIKIIDIVP